MAATENEGPRADVELRLPADSAYVSVLRTTTAGLAARLDFPIDDIEDLRIAVGEASAMVLPEAERGLGPALPVLPGARASSRSRCEVTSAAAGRPRLRQLRLAGAEHPRDQRRGRRPRAAGSRSASRCNPSEPGSDVTPDIMRDDGSPGDAPPTGVEVTRARSAELFVQFRDETASAASRTVARDGLVHLHLPAGRALRPTVPQPRRAVRGPGPGRHHRPDQVDRPVRLRPRRGVLDVRHPDDHRRDQALLPRQGLGDPGAAPAPGAADADRYVERRS